MSKRKPLEWYGDQDGRVGLPICEECSEHMHTPGLMEACASVGIEHDKSAGLMLRDHINTFHRLGHPKAPR